MKTKKLLYQGRRGSAKWEPELIYDWRDWLRVGERSKTADCRPVQNRWLEAQPTPCTEEQR